MSDFLSEPILLSTGEYSANLQNGNGVQADSILPSVMSYAGMDWVGAASGLSSYPSYSSDSQGGYCSDRGLARRLCDPGPD
jgi:hypothetical protein